MHFKGWAHRKKATALTLGLALVGGFALSMGQFRPVEGSLSPVLTPLLTRWVTPILESTFTPTPQPTDIVTDPPVETVEPELTRLPSTTPGRGTLTNTASPKLTSTATATETATATTVQTARATETATATALPTGTPTSESHAQPLNGTVSTSLVLSQIYGGGGNASAPYQNDFIEIYNLGGSTINISGWSVQYASATGATWQVTSLSGSIPPGGYWLVQEASGGGAGVPLPAPDTIGGINLSATAGKIGLVNSTVALSGACPANPSVIDFAGYGGAASCFEGSGPAPAPSNTTAILRNGAGAVDTDNNSTDFVAGPPTPRNSSSSPTATPTPTASFTDTPFPTPTSAATPTDTPSGPTPTSTDTATSTETATPTDTVTATSTPTTTDTATSTNTPTATSTVMDTPTTTYTPTPFAPLAVVINEVAWGGTAASTSDEWIELYNPSGVAIDLTGWVLSSNDGSPNLSLSGLIPVNGYFLLERTDDLTISDVTADQIYAGALTDAGEILILRDPLGNIIDTANGNGGPWPAGSAGPNHYSMERLTSGPESDANWASNNGVIRNGLDANGNPINGTPKSANAVTFPIPTPTLTLTPAQTNTPTDIPTPADTGTATSTTTATAIATSTPTATPLPALSVLVNEVAWGGTVASSGDEWVELYNPNGFAVDLSAWTLTSATDGSPAVTLVGMIPAGGYFLLERTDDNTVSDIPADQIYSGDLGNGGESLILADVGGNVIDTANGDGGGWPAGTGSPNYYSMERITNGPDSDANWGSNNGVIRNGLDANGNPINGTPKNANSTAFPTPTPTQTQTATVTNTPTQTQTSIPSSTPTLTPTNAPFGLIVINEVGWSGSAASTADEWIELYNPNSFTVEITGWTLASTDGSPTITLNGLIPANSYFLLERTDDNSVSDIPADQIYAGDLGNGGEALTLSDPGGNIIDTANGDGGGWPGGTGSPNYYSMERISTGLDSDGNWASNNGINRNGLDANGNPINGTPKNANSTTFPIPTPTETLTATITNTPTQTAAATSTSTPTPTPTSAPFGLIVINEVGWGGTAASTTDEWIELHNPNGFAVSLMGWTLASNDGSPTIIFNGLIPANGYFLLERTDDNSVSDIPADQIYAGDLGNGGEALSLSDPGGNVIDTANGDGGIWPGGTGSPNYSSMERINSGPDGDGNWASNNGVNRNGLDANGNPINGTPKNANSTTYPTPTPTQTQTLTLTPTLGPSPTPTQTPTSVSAGLVIINEVAWGGTGASSADEWIELYNPNGFAVSLAGWTLASNDGSPAVTLNGFIPATGYFLLERTDDNSVLDIPADQIYSGDLSNGGEALTLSDPGGNSIDTANGDGGGWPGGTGSPNYYSMERLNSGPDSDGNWASNNGVNRNGLDANGNPINGTPKNANSPSFPTPTSVATPTFGPSPTPTQTPTPTVTSTGFLPQLIVINEVAWGGTGASASDEWIELYNPNGFAVPLTGWTLASLDASPNIALTGLIPANGYFLLERTDDNTVADIPADQIYVGDLSNAGEALVLRDPGGNAIDTANGDGGAWPAGSGSPNYYTLERLTLGPDNDSNWSSNNGINRNGLDANGNPINGTPKNVNSTTYPTPTATVTPSVTATPTFGPSPTASVTPTPTPTGLASQLVLIHEVAWGGTGASSSDEWIELYNPNADPIDLTGWTLASADGSPSLGLNGVIPANGYFLLERTDDNTVSDIPADQIYVGDLGNGGESLALYDAGNNLVDTANGDGGAWPAGNGSPTHASMERMTSGPDHDGNWASNNGVFRNGLDANGDPINGTPKNMNSSSFPTPTPTPTGTALPTGALVINEVAWAGTNASGNDEWIELYNPNSSAVSLDGWTLSDGGDINITFSALTLDPYGYLLLERSDDAAVSDIAADVIYSGGLNNAGEMLTLRDAANNVLDSASGAGGWPAGDGDTFASMERVSPAAALWVSNNGFTRNGLDAAGDPINGTPKNANSVLFPTPTPAPYPGGILLNEFLAHPGNGVNNEFIEIINTSSVAISLTGWLLDDAEGGSSAYDLPSDTVIQPGALLVFFRTETRIAINDDGDSVRLLHPDGSVADEWSFDQDPKANVSWARFPDGASWNAHGLPTPGESNQVFSDPSAASATPVPIGVLRTWLDGAWATITGRVSGPAPLFGRRIIYIQDDTGGIAVYLGRGDWGTMVEGQPLTVLGYLRHRGGEAQFYVRNNWHVHFGWLEEAAPLSPVPVLTGQIGEATEGQLVTIVGRVVRLEAQAFWIDDGSGPARIFFSSTTGVKRPKVKRGQLWSVTGVVSERTTTRDAVAKFRLQPRFESDVVPLTEGGGVVLETPMPNEIPPTEEPTATPEPNSLGD